MLAHLLEQFDIGNYTGGELVFTDKKSPYYGSHNIKNKWLKFVGDTPHYVKPFKGTRYTLVYYHWTSVSVWAGRRKPDC